MKRATLPGTLYCFRHVTVYSSAEVPFDGREREVELFTFGRGDRVPGSRRSASAFDCSARTAKEASRWGERGGGGAIYELRAGITVLDAREHMVAVPEVHEAVTEAWLKRARVEVLLADDVVVCWDLGLPFCAERHPVLGCVLRHRLFWRVPVREGVPVGARLCVAAAERASLVNVDARIHVVVDLEGTEGARG